MKRMLVVLLVVGCGTGDKGIENMPTGRIPEVVDRLDAIAKRANAVFRETKKFPIGTSAELPARNGEYNLAGGCCGSTSTAGGTMDHKCPASTAWATDPVWKALGYSIDAAEDYRYKYTSTDGATYVVTATGDVDCDAEEAVYTLRGAVASEHPTAHLELPRANTY